MILVCLKATEERIMNSLPSRNEAMPIVAITFVLSQLSPNEVRCI